MLDYVIIDKKLKNAIKLVNFLYEKNEHFRIVAIYDCIEKLLIFLQERDIDLILIKVNHYEYRKLLENNLLKEKCKSIVLISNDNIVNKDSDINKWYGYVIDEENYEDISNIIDEFSRTKIVARIENELKYLNVRNSYLGVKFLIEAICILYNNNVYKNCHLEKDIYPLIAQKYYKTVNNVKSNINYVVNILYVECEEEKLKKYIEEYNIYKYSPKKIIFSILKRIENSNIVSTQLSKGNS